MRRLERPRRVVALVAIPLLAVTVAIGCRKREDRDAPRADPAAKPLSRAESVTIGRLPPRVGQKVRETRRTELRLVLTGLLATEIRKTEASVQDQEILAVDGDRVTKLRVTYVSKSESSPKPGLAGAAAAHPPHPVEGKTYVVEALHGKVVVTDGGGKPVSAIESRTVGDDHRALGEPDPVRAAMPDRPLKPGERVPELAAAIARRLAGPWSGEDAVTDVEVTLRSVDGGDAVFAIETSRIVQGSGAAAMAMRATLAGTLRVRIADGWVTELTVEGPVHFDASGGAGKHGGAMIEAKGRLELGVTRRYG